MPTSIHAAGPTGQRSPGLDAAIAGYLAENPPAGGGGASALDDLTDVDTTGQTTGDVLKFNGTTWVADSASAGTVSSTDISDSSAVGRSVLTAADAATARTAIGAGTSSLVLGTTAGTAKAGDYAPDLSGYVPTSRTVNGKALSANITLSAADVGASTFSGVYADLTSKPTLGDAAAKNTGTAAGTVAAGNDSRITGAAQKSANLSDLANAGTARTNLGLGTAATTAASAYATAAQGALADTALQVATAQPINAQTGTTYTLQASDAGKLVTLDNAGAITLNAPGSTFTAGQRVDVLVLNTGMATVVGTSGASGNGTPSLVSRARYSAFTVVWLTATTFVVVGDLATP